MPKPCMFRPTWSFRMEKSGSPLIRIRTASLVLLRPIGRFSQRWAQRVRPVRKERKVLQGLKGHLAPRDQKVRPELRVHRAHQVRKEFRACRDFPASKGRLGP